MAHKISLINEQTASKCFWNKYDNNPYNDEKIAMITDNIGNIEVPVTSIPSPFARIHLFEAAFNYVVEYYNRKKNQKTINEKTTYHHLISDCLDVYEMLFSYDELQLDKKIKLINWDFSKLKALQESSKSGRRIFADVFQLYINNYNKDERFTNNGIENPFHSFAILLLNNKVIAGTSPFTGFYTTANLINDEVRNHDGRVFFSNIMPLYKRSLKFQRFINLFFESQPQVIHAFPAVHKYLEINRKFITDIKTKKFISEITAGEHLDEINEWDILYINESALNILPEIRYRFKKIDGGKTIVDIIKKCDYIIRTRKTISKPPMALKENLKNTHWNYIKGNPLDENTKIPSIDSMPYEERTIPGFDTIKYPYVLRNDFLSKYIIELDYEINDAKFWMGKSDKIARNVLLPIKPDYFRFFTIKDLKENLTITKLDSGSITVHLEIPICADNGRAKITFERTYNKINPNNLEGENKGVIIPSIFYFGIYPFYKSKSIVYNDLYKIAIFNDESVKVDCSFFRENISENKLIPVSISKTFVRTREAEGLGVVSKYIEISKDLDENDKDIQFDFVSINCQVNDFDIHGLIIPIMPEIGSLSQTASAIAYDIGTSNTFISISANGSAEKLSTFNRGQEPGDMHFVMLHKAITDVDDIRGSNQYDINSRHDLRFRPLQLNEFMPSLIGEKSEYSFPIKTIINQDNDCDAANENNINVLASINIPFAFGNEKMRNDFDNAYSNLKWEISNIENIAARNRLKAFVEQLVIMGRNKILSEGKDPSKTDVLWFKPLSMATGQIAIFENFWNEFYTKYFSKQKGNTKKLHHITESWAPFYSYEKTFVGRYFLNIDIGGGTTDLLAFKDIKPTLTCSFRFAGNNLFDNGFNFDDADANIGRKKDNGFVLKYEKIMRKMFEDNKDEDKLDILQYIYDSSELNSEDIIGFFFGIKEFSNFLKLDKDFMLLFLLHNAAIFYHSAQILKSQNPDLMPTDIGLSGNGARLLEIPNKNNDLNRAKGMSHLVSQIFKFVFGQENVSKINLQILDNPKESTAIGGIKGLKQILNNPTADIDNYYIPLGDNDTIIHNGDFETKKKYSYRYIRDDSAIVERIASNYSGFITYFFECLWYECDMPNNFDVDKSYNTEKLIKYFNNPNNITNVLDSAINYKMLVEKELELNETMFFIPLRAYIYDFSKIIADESELNKFKGI